LAISTKEGLIIYSERGSRRFFQAYGVGQDSKIGRGLPLWRNAAAVGRRPPPQRRLLQRGGRAVAFNTPAAGVSCGIYLLDMGPVRHSDLDNIPDEYFLHKICHTLQKIIQITIPFITNIKKIFVENIINLFLQFFFVIIMWKK
jgi:hypothetical protein